MPALPVIADVMRVTLNWEPLAGVAPRNVLHFRHPGIDPVEAATAVGAALTDEMFAAMHAGYLCNQLAVLPLDGTTATFLQTFVGVSGNGDGDFLPAVSALVSLRTGVRGPRGRGRCYVGPTTESSSAGGTLLGAAQTDMQAAWDTFRAAVTTAFGDGGLVVVSYTHGDENPVVSSTVEHLLATQRRRQGQLR
jgi:hypothetical protein